MRPPQRLGATASPGALSTCVSPRPVRPAAKKYAGFLASEAVIKQIPRLLGPGLNKSGKFPTLVTHSDKLELKVGALSVWAATPTISSAAWPAQHTAADP